MNKLNVKIVLCAVVTGMCLSSCVTMNIAQLTPEEKHENDVIGNVSSNFISFQPLHIIFKKSIENKSKAILMDEAREKYDGQFEIRNINVSGNWSALSLLPLPTIYSFAGTFQKIHASGDVVKSKSSNSKGGVKELALKISETFKGNTEKTTIAILDFTNINGKVSTLGKFTAEQTTTGLFQISNLKMVERGQIAQVVNEWEFSNSGMVDQDQMIELGKILGVNAIVLGTLTKIGSKIMINARVVDAKTASIMATASTEMIGDDYIRMYNDILNE